MEILAAGQQATVYVNGEKVIYHEGGYSTFRADITEYCKEEGENLLVVNCDNSAKDSVYPQHADFTFYGGLYRALFITYHGPNPKVKDYSEEYQALYHEHMEKVLDERPWIWSSHVWNMFDFGCAARNEGGVAGRNNKGLMTMDRKTKKDSYYVYQAYWTTDPMVHLCGKRYAQRAGETTEIRVYSNQPTVALYLNGEPVEEKSAEKVFVFTVALKDGFNILMADAGEVKDTMTLEKVEKEPEIYTLPGGDDGSEGAANWFTQMGDL